MGHRFTTVKSRIADFTDKGEIPAAKYDIDGNAQVAHARIAVATSNVVGKGPGNSVQRDFLSQAFSDFIYAIIIEELGLVGGIVVVFLYICLLIRVGRIARKCDRTFPAFLITGIALLLVTQALFNIDGSRRIGSRHGTTASTYQQRRNFHIHQLRLYRHDIECEPLYCKIR